MPDRDQLAAAVEAVEQPPVARGEFERERLGPRRDDPVRLSQVRLLVGHGHR